MWIPMRPLALLLALLALAALPAGAGKVKVYKYETREGKVEYGTEVPPGAIVLAEVGEVEDPRAKSLPRIDLPSAAEAPGAVSWGLERARGALAARPLAGGVFGFGLFLWSVLVLRAFPPLFSTLNLDLRRCFRLAGLCLCGWLFVALCGQLLDWLWPLIHWAPKDEFRPGTLATLGWLPYVAVTLLAFSQRLGVGFVQAALLALLWLGIVALGGYLAGAYLLV